MGTALSTIIWMPKKPTADHETQCTTLGHAADMDAHHEEEFCRAMLQGMKTLAKNPTPKPRTDIRNVQTPPFPTPTMRTFMTAFWGN